MAATEPIQEVSLINEQLKCPWLMMNELEVQRLLMRLDVLLRSGNGEYAFTIHILVGLLYLRQHAEEKALKEFKASLGLLQPDSPITYRVTALVNIAHTLRCLHRYEDALGVLLEITDIEGENAWRDGVLLGSLTTVFSRLNRWEDASFFFGKAQEATNMDDADQVFWLAEAAAFLERYELAVTLLARAVTLRYGSDDIPPLEHVEKHEEKMNLPNELLGALDYMTGRRDQRVLLESTPIASSPEMDEERQQVMDEMAPFRARATQARIQDLAHAK